MQEEVENEREAGKRALGKAALLLISLSKTCPWDSFPRTLLEKGQNEQTLQVHLSDQSN